MTTSMFTEMSSCDSSIVPVYPAHSSHLHIALAEETSHISDASSEEPCHLHVGFAKSVALSECLAPFTTAPMTCAKEIVPQSDVCQSHPSHQSNIFINISESRR